MLDVDGVFSLYFVLKGFRDIRETLIALIGYQERWMLIT